MRNNCAKSEQEVRNNYPHFKHKQLITSTNVCNKNKQKKSAQKAIQKANKHTTLI